MCSKYGKLHANSSGRGRPCSRRLYRFILELSYAKIQLRTCMILVPYRMITIQAYISKSKQIGVSFKNRSEGLPKPIKTILLKSLLNFLTYILPFDDVVISLVSPLNYCLFDGQESGQEVTET